MLKINYGRFALWSCFLLVFIVSDLFSQVSGIVLEEIQTGGVASSPLVETNSNVTAVADHFYIAAISTKSKVGVINVSGLGLAWMPLIDRCSGRNQTGVMLWIGQGTPSVTGKVTALLNNSPSNAVMTVLRFSGVDVDDPLGASVSANTNGVNGSCAGGVDNAYYSFGLSTTADGAALVAFAGFRNRSHTPGAGYTEHIEISQGSSGSMAALSVMSKTVATASSQTVEGTFSGDVDWAAAAVELKPGGSEPGIYSLVATVDPSIGGTISRNPDKSLYRQGETVTLAASAASGYLFSTWSGDIGGANPADISISVTMDQNRSISAHFQPLPAYVQAAVTSSDDAPLGGETVTAEINVDMSATGSALGSFAGSLAWDESVLSYAGNSGLQSGFSGAVDDANAAAGSLSFSGSHASGAGGNPIVLQVTFTVIGSAGTVSSLDLAFSAMQSFTGQNLIPTLSITGSSLMVSGHSLAVTAVPAGNSVAVDPQKTLYDQGESVTLSAVPASGFQFDYWSGDIGAANPQSASIMVTMDQGRSITAHFAGGNAEVVYEGTVTGGSSGQSSVQTAANVTAAAGQLYLAAVSSKPYMGVSSVSGLGLSWTRVDVQCSGRSQNMVDIWMAIGTPGGDGIVRANFASNPSHAVIAVTRYSGVNEAMPLNNAASANTNGVDGGCSGGSDSRDYAFDLETTVGGAVVYGVASTRHKTHTPGSGYTERVEISQGSSSNMVTIAVQDQTRETAGLTVVDGTMNGKVDWSAVGLEIIPGGSSGPRQYTLTAVVNPAGQGSITLAPDKILYDDGESVLATAAPADGWRFLNWSGDISGAAATDNPITLVMNRSRNITANFALVDNQTPVNYKVAFFGDQGLGANALAVLNMIDQEGADMIMHDGDLDYTDDPQAWEDQVAQVFPADFPYFVVFGDKELNNLTGPGGYQERCETRMNTIGVSWDGSLGIKSSYTYNGIFFVTTAPGVSGSNHSSYIRDQLAADNSIWRISVWHKNMTDMSPGLIGSPIGWEVYEESRKAGVMIITGDDHLYGRSHLMSSMENQTVSSTSDTLVLTKDNPGTPEDEGRNFVAVSGLGGRGINEQRNFGSQWANVYSRLNGARPGALFGVFNYDGQPDLARFYFKDIDGNIADNFYVRSATQTALLAANNTGKRSALIYSQGGSSAGAEALTTSVLPEAFALAGNFPNPFNPETTIKYALPRDAEVRITVYNVLGQALATLVNEWQTAGFKTVRWQGVDDNGQPASSGLYFILMKVGRHQFVHKVILQR